MEAIGANKAARAPSTEARHGAWHGARRGVGYAALALAVIVGACGPSAVLTSAGLVAAPSPVAATVAVSREIDMAQDLIDAAMHGDVARIEELLAGGADVNARDAQGRTPVMAATYGNHPEAVARLLAAGADVNIRDGRLNNPFLYAGAEGYLEILKLAHAAGADPTLTNRFGGTALIPACERGHVEVVRYLLTETAVDVDHVNNLGWTALLEAIVLSDGGPRHQQSVALLIEHGVDVNIPDRGGVAPLRHARQRGYREIAAQLEAAGARE